MQPEPMAVLRRVCWLAPCLAAWLLPGPAAGHGLHAREGAVVVHTDRVVTRLQAATGDGELPWEIVVRDEPGVRRPASVTGRADPDEAGHRWVTVEHRLDAAPNWLSFQLRPGPDPRGRQRRLTLTVTDRTDPTDRTDRTEHGADDVRTIDLTSGGNVETLRFGARPVASPVSKACGVAWLDRHPERLQAVHALLDRGGVHRTRLTVVVPLVLLESWQPIDRADGDFLDVAEQDAARAAVLHAVSSRIQVEHDGRPSKPNSADVAFLGLDDRAGGTPRSRRLGTWTARVRVSLDFDPGGTIEWNLFNARVLGAEIVLVDDRSCTQRHLTTTDRRL